MSSVKLTRIIVGLVVATVVSTHVASAQDLYVSGLNRQLLRYDGSTGSFIGPFTMIDGVPGEGRADGVAGARALIFGPDGNLYVASRFESAVLRFDGQTGAFIDKFVTTRSGGLDGPEGLAFGPDGNLYVSDTFGRFNVLRFDGTTGAFIDTFIAGPDDGGPLRRPFGLVFGRDGNLYVSDVDLHGVLRFNGTTGSFIDVFASPVPNPRAPIFGPDGNLYIAESGSDSILRFDGNTGGFLDVFVPGFGSDLGVPIGIAFGPDGNLYITSSQTNRVLRFDGQTGALIDEFIPAGSGGLIEPVYLAFSNGNNMPPVANAGPDQPIHAGTAVHLDGSLSHDDNTPTPSLVYSWSFSSFPTGNTAVLSGAASVAPSFTPNVTGTYVVRLVVTDDHVPPVSSAPTFVTLSSFNQAPSAVATATPTIPYVGQAVSLDGSGSQDPDGDAIAYLWTVTSPVGSAATLAGAMTPTAIIIPDTPGTYRVTLTASDFLGAGTPAAVTLVASSASTFAESEILAACAIVEGLSSVEVTSKGNQKEFCRLLRQTVREIQSRHYCKAVEKLTMAMQRTDGYPLRDALDVRGEERDWLTNSEAQRAVYADLMAARTALAGLPCGLRLGDRDRDDDHESDHDGR